MNHRNIRLAIFAGLTIILSFAGFASAQRTGSAAGTKTVSAALPKVTQIDMEALRKLIKPNGKPLMINFWATWCDPCREEFPDLVKVDAAYRGKIDFLTVSLDDLGDKDTFVPKFLGEMKAEMPTYLLITTDEDAAMKAVTPEWAGNLPMTILFAADGNTAYLRKGKIRIDALNAEIEKLLPPLKLNPGLSDRQIVDLPLSGGRTYTFEAGVAAAQHDVSAKTYKLLRYGLTIVIPTEQLDKLKKRYAITVEESGCMVSAGYDKYVVGYNATMKAALQKKFGSHILPDIAFASTEIPTSYQ